MLHIKSAIYTTVLKHHLGLHYLYKEEIMVRVSSKITTQEILMINMYQNAEILM